MTSTEKKRLRTRAHALKPVVTVGQSGLTESVLKELELAIEHHELIKIRLSAGDRDQRKEWLESICLAIRAEPVQVIGHTATIYRKSQT